MIAITITVCGGVAIVIHIPRVVDIDARSPVVVAVVIVAVVRMAPIGGMVDVQVVIRPADRKGRRYAPKVVGMKTIAGRVRIVVDRIRIWVVVIDRTRLINHDLGRFVIRHINDFLADRYDLDDTIIIRNGLILIGLEIAGSVGSIPKSLDCSNHVSLLTNNGVTESPGPVDILIHHLNDIRVIQQGDDRFVPLIVRLEIAIGFEEFQESRRLNDLERIGRCRQDDRKQIVGIERNRSDQVLKIGGRKSGCR